MTASFPAGATVATPRRDASGRSALATSGPAGLVGAVAGALLLVLGGVALTRVRRAPRP